MATPNYNVNYDDDRFTKVTTEKTEALSDLEKTYSDMIANSDSFYDKQIQASKDYADQQAEIQNQQTGLLVDQINQQKEQAQKDYIKEQSGSYVDWQKQSNQYGANAEKMASSGLTNTGFSESSQVAMYNTYQNRVATARESFNQATLAYDNNIKEAKLQNNAALAEIYAKAYQQQLELDLQGFQYKNNLLIEQANKKLEVENLYYQRWQDVLNQINTENAMAEQIRQYEQNYELQTKQFEEQIRQFNDEIERLKKKDEEEYKLQIEELELKKQQLEEEKRQFDKKYAARRSSGTTTETYTNTKPQTTTTIKSPLQTNYSALLAAANQQQAAKDKVMSVVDPVRKTVKKWLGVDIFKDIK